MDGNDNKKVVQLPVASVAGAGGPPAAGNIRVYADEALRRMSRVFSQMYSERGRDSVPPEMLLKSTRSPAREEAAI